jgi:hypothetical protein
MVSPQHGAMNPRARLEFVSCVLAFVLCFLAVGLPYWSIPYTAVSLPDTLLTPALYLVGVAALLLAWRVRTSIARTVVFAGGSLPAAVAARIAVETSQDPTSHNLFPFELAFAIGVALMAALPGAVLGRLLARLMQSALQRGSSA